MKKLRTTNPHITNTAAPRLCRRLTGTLRRLFFGRVPKLFDTGHYLRNHPDAAASALDPYLHYILIGGRRNYDPNGDFDTIFYRTQAKTVRNPLRHFIKIGAAEGFDPHPQFSTFGYLGRYQDVVASKVNPLLHYRQDGRSERRIADPSTRLPRSMIALAGIPSAYHWVLPSEGQMRVNLTMLRTPPSGIAVELIAQLRISITIEFDVVDQVIYAISRFPTGVQDATQLIIPANVVRGGGIPNLILALEQCYIHPATKDGTRVVQYGQGVLWDSRPIPPRVSIRLPDGIIRF